MTGRVSPVRRFEKRHGAWDVEHNQTAAIGFASRPNFFDLAFDRKRRLACAMENSIQVHAPYDIIVSESERTIAPPPHMSDASIEAQISAQRTRNASAIARAQQKVLRERQTPRRLRK
jgi:hypothetical protein